MLFGLLKAASKHGQGNPALGLRPEGSYVEPSLCCISIQAHPAEPTGTGSQAAAPWQSVSWSEARLGASESFCLGRESPALFGENKQTLLKGNPPVDEWPLVSSSEACNLLLPLLPPLDLEKPP